MLDIVVDRIQDATVLVVITSRPEFTPPWTGSTHVTSLTLNRLGRRHCEMMVSGVTGGKALPPEVLDQIVTKTDGMPLFVEELTKTVLESGILKPTSDAYVLTGPLPPLAIPTSLQDSLMARLDRLLPVKEIAQLGATIGREFSYKLLTLVSPLRDNELQDALHQLVGSQLVSQRGTPPEATYTFKHALVQDTSYESLLKSTRQRFHQKIADSLEQHFEDVVAIRPEIVAYHYTEAQLTTTTRRRSSRNGRSTIGSWPGKALRNARQRWKRWRIFRRPWNCSADCLSRSSGTERNLAFGSI
jgi:predicted ATPase